MKKSSLVAAVLASMTLAVAVPAFAATNPFVDVPAKHWAYDSVSKLAAAGIVDGYGDGTFVGDKNMTRYEMAQIVAKALTKYDAANASNKAIMDKLTKEFGDELKNLGVRVAALEKNQPNVKVTGESRVRYLSDDVDTSTIQGTSAFDLRQRLYLNAKINDKVTYTGRLEATMKDAANTATTAFNRNYFTIKDFMGIDTTMLGRQGAYVGKNMNVGKSSNNDGLIMSHKLGEVTLTGFALTEAEDVHLNGIYAGANLGKNADLEIGYTNSDSSQKSFDIGASVQFGNGFSLVGEFVDTNNEGNPDGQAYAVQLTYGVKTTKIGATSMGLNIVDKSKPHTSGFLIGYREIEEGSLALNGAASIFRGSAVGPYGATSVYNDSSDVKGMMYAFQNVLAKNTILSLEYQDLEDECSDYDVNKTFTGSVQFWF